MRMHPLTIAANSWTLMPLAPMASNPTRLDLCQPVRSAARGDVWLADLSPVRGHEQAGRRPVLVASVDPFNQSRADLVVVIPITSTLRSIPFHVVVQPPEGGLTNPSCSSL